MFVKQLYTKSLNQNAYFIVNDGEAAVIDPIRNIEAYLDLAAEKDVKIKYIFETHIHADFVSGHLDLAKATGATIVYGPTTTGRFKFKKANDGDIFELGKAKIQVIHTPGHTLESTCYLLQDETGKPYSIFTGDTLLIGDVGRPDIMSEDMNTEELAGLLFDSINTKIKTLADDVIVYPTHGKIKASTIASEKLNNKALKDQPKVDFIKMVTTGLAAVPAYYPVNAKLNSKGYENIEDIIKKASKKLSVETVDTIVKAASHIILDTRNATVFTNGFIPTAINIGLEGQMEEWAGTLLSFETPIVLITDKGKDKETITRLSSVGFDKFEGVLKGGFEAWTKANKNIDMIIDVTADELSIDIPFDENIDVIDVRKESEYEMEHIKDAENLPLHLIINPLELAQLDDEANIYIHCDEGYTSVIACSLLKKEGYANVRNVLGGFIAIKETKNFTLEVPKKVRQNRN